MAWRPRPQAGSQPRSRIHMPPMPTSSKLPTSYDAWWNPRCDDFAKAILWWSVEQRMNERMPGTRSETLNPSVSV